MLNSLLALLLVAAVSDTDPAAIRRAMPTARGDELVRLKYSLALLDSDPVAAIEALKDVPSGAYKARALLASGEFYLLMGNPGFAVEPFTAAAALREGAVSERAAWLRGVALLEDGKFADARAAFSDYLVAYLEGAHQVPARIGIARANEQLGQPRTAIEIYKAILAQHRGLSDEQWIMDRVAALRGQADTIAPVAPRPVPRVEPVRPVAPPRVETPVAPRGDFSVQVGAFGALENAEKQLAKFKERGHQGVIVRRGNLHIVRVGRFRTGDEARAVMADFEAIAGNKVAVVKVEGE